jgi:riboflavin synthase
VTPDPDETGSRLRLRVPADLLRYVVEKGSLTVDGVSLTVAELFSDGVAIALIPHTLVVTTLGSVRPGDPVNLEVDVIAKYVERLMERADA